MHKRPEITPAATCSSAKGLQISSPCAKDESDCDTPSTSERKRKQRESDTAKRHREKMQRWDKFNSLFEKMLEKM